MNFSDKEHFPQRRKTRPVKVGRYTIGGNAAVVVQSMTKTDTRNVDKTVEQIQQLEQAGCEIVRLAVPDIEAAKALKDIRKKCPDSVLVSDIHFQYKFALMALDAGMDKLRINPGNIGDAEKVRTVVRRAQEQKVPIRIGVNAGSLERRLLEKYGFPTPEAMVESAEYHIRILEDLGFTDTIISLKSSNVKLTVAAYRLLAARCDYPFHLGITEAGTQFSGTVKSCAGMGMLLAALSFVGLMALPSQHAQDFLVEDQRYRQFGARVGWRQVGGAVARFLLDIVGYQGLTLACHPGDDA